MRHVQITRIVLLLVMGLAVYGAAYIISIVFFSASPDDNGVVPTLADIHFFPTADFLTENAPPPGFGLVNFDPIEANLSNHQGWSYKVSAQFDGTFDDTGEPATGTLDVQVWSNELGEARRVVFGVEGAAFSPDESRRELEGVRLSNDYFMLDANKNCETGTEDASIIAELSAGQLLGGVTNAVPTGHRQEVDGLPAWQYTFAPESVRLPTVNRQPNSYFSISADLWISPDANAVLLFDLVLAVEKVTVLWSSRSVSGTLIFHYQLDVPELDTLPNISIPNGCKLSWHGVSGNV